MTIIVVYLDRLTGELCYRLFDSDDERTARAFYKEQVSGVMIKAIRAATGNAKLFHFARGAKQDYWTERS